MRPLATALALATAFYATPSLANGRMPGATALSITGDSGERLVVRATFGLVQSFDAGQRWQWICENAIQVSGEADPPTTVTGDGTLLLLPPAGGALVSRNGGCSWDKVDEPLAGKRTMDLTRDPANASRVLIVTSTVVDIDARGIATYANQLVETTNDAATWTVLATLPSDFSAETLEIAPSDSARIYVSGTANDDPLGGVLLCSEDRGQTWTRRTLALPQGSGSLFISGIHPSDPDRLWVRVPARDDRFGLFPASLMVSGDKGEHFEPLATTQRGMLGFALSPDGAELAYGGPYDGLFVGASDGTAGFAKANNLGVRCLKWNESGLYACGSEPPDPFSVGRSRDRGATFEPLYRMSQTCPAVCADTPAFEAACRGPWQSVGPAIGAQCAGDAGADAGSTPDAGVDGGVAASADGADDGCACTAVGATRPPGASALLLLLLFARRRHAALRAPRFATNLRSNKRTRRTSKSSTNTPSAT